MQYILDTKSVRCVENMTIGISCFPGIMLMEQAGTLAAKEISDRFIKKGGRIAVVCGKGNNGGDGLVIGRHLSENKDITVEIFLVTGDKKQTYMIDSIEILQQIKEHVSDDNYNMIFYIIARGGKVIVLGEDYEAYITGYYDLIVDALFGIGLNREVTGLYKNIILKINSLSEDNGKTIVLSVDVPSGINTDNGLAMGAAVKASHTITFNYKKPCHLIYPGKKYCGEVIIIYINFDNRFFEEIKEQGDYITTWDENDVINDLIPPRYEDSNKGTYGRLCVIAGCERMPGAALLCTEAAYRMGVGYVCLSSDEKVTDILAVRLPEAVLNNNYKEINDNNYNAFVIGPGISKNDRAVHKIKYILDNFRDSDASFVFDADAINIIAELLDERGIIDTIERINMLNSILPEKSILTPHKKELSGLLKINMDKLASLYDVAVTIREYSKAVFVLKDAHSIVVTKGRMHINNVGCNALSVAGSGDVLSGIIGAYIAQHYECFEAACLACHVHGFVGKKAAEKTNMQSVIPGDLIEELKHL